MSRSNFNFPQDLTANCLRLNRLHSLDFVLGLRTHLSVVVCHCLRFFELDSERHSMSSQTARPIDLTTCAAPCKMWSSTRRSHCRQGSPHRERARYAVRAKRIGEADHPGPPYTFTHSHIRTFTHSHIHTFTHPHTSTFRHPHTSTLPHSLTSSLPHFFAFSHPYNVHVDLSRMSRS